MKNSDLLIKPKFIYPQNRTTIKFQKKQKYQRPFYIMDNKKKNYLKNILTGESLFENTKENSKINPKKVLKKLDKDIKLLKMLFFLNKEKNKCEKYISFNNKNKSLNKKKRKSIGNNKINFKNTFRPNSSKINKTTLIMEKKKIENKSSFDYKPLFERYIEESNFLRKIDVKKNKCSKINVLKFLKNHKNK